MNDVNEVKGANLMSNQANIREEERKNRVAAAYFGKYDCGRIVGNIDFCVSPKRRDPRQMTFIPEAPILWAEAKNHRHPPDARAADSHHQARGFLSHMISYFLFLTSGNVGTKKRLSRG